MPDASTLLAAEERPLAGLLPAAALAAFVFAAGAAASYAPPATGEMAVVFPFGTDQRTAYQMIVAEGGQLVGGSRLANILIAYAPDAGFAARIRGAGALFTLAARGLCGPAADATIES